RGPFSYRVVIPVFLNKRLVTWTGRSIAPSEELRYRSLSTDPEKANGLPVALENIKHTLFDYDSLKEGGRVLAVAEGPLDAMRLGFLGERYGIKATCLFGKSLHPMQLDLLHEI